MITSLLLSVTLVTDTTVTITRESRDMQFGRDKVSIELTHTAVRLGCVKHEITVGDLKVKGTLYVWTGTLICTK
jgi:hypothetical protein